MKTSVLLISLLLLIAGSCKKDNVLSYPSAGLISYFNFDDNLTDQQDYTDDGVGTAIFGVGKIGMAAVFNGINQRIEFTPKVVKPNAELSVACWYKTSDTGIKSILSQENANADIFALAVNSNNVVFIIKSGVVSANLIAPFTLGEWNHVVGTFDGAIVKIYSNGVLIDSKSFNESFTGFESTLFVGAPSYFPGSIDELYIYNRAITQAEVTQLYNLN